MHRYIGYIFILLAACTSKPAVNGGERLKNSDSDYLREHADNPVQWYEWSDEAFERASKENKPVIVSIGYASCYWCHQMEKDVFMDSSVAEYMNEHFISIKVDREQRPDIDQLFLHAAEVLNATAGWPMNAFATSEGKPFTTVTYQTKDEWIKLVNSVNNAWTKDKNKLSKQANDVEKNISIKEQYPFVTDTVLRHDLQAFLNSTDDWDGSLDFRNGGIKEQQKFYRPSLLQFMLQHTTLNKLPEEKKWLELTLDRSMTHVQEGEGGFYRYFTDTTWTTPHYEKMLYDNGQMVSVFSKAYLSDRRKSYFDTVTPTLRFIESKMMSDSGAFYSSIDAEERDKVYRNTVLSWNAMMTIGFIDAYKSLGDEHYKDVALKNASFIQSNLFSNGEVYRSTNKSAGFLDDYAWTALAFINLYQATFDIHWLEAAKQITDVALTKFDKTNDDLYYYSSASIKGDIQRNTELFDTMIPSSNSVFAEVLLLLGEYYQNEKYTYLGTKAVNKAISPFSVEGVYLANWARIAEAMQFHPYEIAIVGDKALDYAHELQKHNLPPAIFLGGTEENLPLLENKKVQGQTMIYVCKNRTCKFPVKTPAEALKLITK